MPIVLAAGVLVGFALRVLLVNWRAKSEAKLNLKEAADRLTDEKNQHQDQGFQDVMNAQLGLIVAQLQEERFDFEKAKKTVTDAQAALDKALDDLAKLRKQVQDSLTAFADAPLRRLFRQTSPRSSRRVATRLSRSVLCWPWTTRLAQVARSTKLRRRCGPRARSPLRRGRRT